MGPWTQVVCIQLIDADCTVPETTSRKASGAFSSTCFQPATTEYVVGSTAHLCFEVFSSRFRLSKQRFLSKTPCANDYGFDGAAYEYFRSSPGVCSQSFPARMAAQGFCAECVTYLEEEL